MAVKRLNSGDLRERVTLRTRAQGVDALGQESQAWTDVATVWAQVLPVRGREYFAAAQMQSPTDVRMVIRWRSDVNPQMQAVWNGQPHDIVSVIDPGARRQVLELMCISGIRDGALRAPLQAASSGVFLSGAGVFSDGQGLFLA